MTARTDRPWGVLREAASECGCANAAARSTVGRCLCHDRVRSLRDAFDRRASTGRFGLAGRYPHSRLAWGFEDAKRRWRTDRAVESIGVVERDWDSGLRVGNVLDGIARDESLEPPLTFIRYPDHWGMRMSHSLGDGPMFITVLAAPLMTAVAKQQLPWPASPGGRMPLLSAAWRTFGRHPYLVPRYPRS